MSRPNPIAVKDLMRYLPHRPPMVWVDQVIDFSLNHGEVVVEVKGDALYMSPEGLRASSLLEFIAQAYGFVWICYVKHVLDPSSKGMQQAMVAGFKQARFAPPTVLRRVADGDILVVKLTDMRRKGPITFLHGQVWFGNILLGESEMRTFSQ